MKTTRYGWVVAALLATAAGCGRNADEAGGLMDENLTEEQAVQASVIAALDDLNGRVNWEEQAQGDPRLEVTFSNKPITDAELKLIIHQFQRSKEFHYLDLSGTQVSDEGLKELKEVRHLRTLNLSRTRVTDEGLKELKGYTRLKWLKLDGTPVTSEGLSELTKALPDCKVECEEEEGRRLVRRVREVVGRVVPAEAAVLVFRYGDDDLLRLGGRPARHFPQTADGGYRRGYPEDSAEAVAWLEAARAKGGQFLVVPEPALWWLKDYPGLRQHLEKKYRLAAREDKVCLVFDLR